MFKMIFFLQTSSHSYRNVSLSMSSLSPGDTELNGESHEWDCVCYSAAFLFVVWFQPKCGFLPSSKHVSKDIKTKVCRFCMHQHYKVSTKKITQQPQYNTKTFDQGSSVWGKESTTVQPSGFCSSQQIQQNEMSSLSNLSCYVMHICIRLLDKCES